MDIYTFMEAFWYDDNDTPGVVYLNNGNVLQFYQGSKESGSEIIFKPEELKKIQENKINILKKKTSSFDDTSVKEVSEHLIQKITNQIANHLRDSDDFEEELESIKTIFQLNHNDY